MNVPAPLGTGLGLGPGPSRRRAPSLQRNRVALPRSLRAWRRGNLLIASSGVRQNFTDAFVKRGRRQPGDDSETAGSGIDLGSVFRNVFDFSSPKAAAATAATATATAAGMARPPGASAAAGPQFGDPAAGVAFNSTAGSVPAGPYAAAQMVTASSAIPGSIGVDVGGASGPVMDTVAQQVLTGHSAVQDDPVAAARQLQMFLSQYRDQYGPETDSRISAAVSKLQDYIDGYGTSAGGAADGMGAIGGGATAAAAAAAAAGGGGEGGVVYHNYILEQLTGVLDWINNLLVNNNPKPFQFDAYGRVLEDASAAASVEQQQEQLRAASSSLRLLISQLQQVNRQYAAMADPDEKAAMGQVLSQLTTMADRLAAAATRRPLPGGVGAGGAAADAAAATAAAANDLTPYVLSDQVYGVEKYRDPLLRVLDGIYHAVVVDSGLREFLTGIKQLGDSLVASMAVAWTGAPPIGRLIAYIAAISGVVFLMRSRLPPSLTEPTAKFFDQLSLGSNFGTNLPSSNASGDGSSSASNALPPASSSSSSSTPGAPSTPANPVAAAAFAAITSNSGSSGDGPAAAAAAAAAFAAIAANGGGQGQSGSNPLSDLDRDWGVGDTRLPSEILASNDPYAARKALVDAQATPVAVGRGAGTGQAAAVAVAAGSGGGSGDRTSSSRRSGGFGNGWATLTGAATAPSQAATPASSAGATGSDSTSPGLYTNPSFPGALPKPPPGGWSGQYSDRADWWTLGSQQPQQQDAAAAQAAAAPPPPPPSYGKDPSGRPRTVAESWEAFRRINTDTSGTAAAASLPPTGGMLDTTAALAAAAVAAAAGATDPKMAELARATEERRMDKDRARLRATIKDRLRWVCLALGPVSSVVPGGEPLRDEVDGLLAQLEALSPTDKPLNTVVDVTRRPTVGPPAPLVDPLLLGDWRLVYASNASSPVGGPSAATQAASGGPNLLAQILHIADSLPGFGMTQVVQRLTLESGPSSATYTASSAITPNTRFSNTPPTSTVGGAAAASTFPRPGGSDSPSGAATSSYSSYPSSSPRSATILTENSAVFRFGPLGSWRVSVRGRWIDNGGGLCAAAEFESFAVRPVDLWGLPVAQLLPEVVVPVPDVLRSRSEWCTTYLDEDMRVGRGSGGTLFLFKRGAVETDAAAAAAAAAATVRPPPPPAAPVPAGAASNDGMQQPVMRPL